MRQPRLFSAVILSLFLIVHGHSADPHEAIRGFLSTYCVSCHGATKQKADRRYDQVALPITKQNDLFDLQDAIDQLNLGEMPPEKHEKHPSSAEVSSFVAALTAVLAEGRKQFASTGSQTVLRRLNHREYRNTIGTLFGMNMVVFDPTLGMPRDQTVHHLDTIGNTLQTSPFLLDLYLDAADRAVTKAFASYQKVPEQTWSFTKGLIHRPKLRDQKTKKLFGDEQYLALYENVNSEHQESAYATLPDFDNGVPADGTYEITVVAEAKNRKHPYEQSIFGTDPSEPFRLGIVPGDVKAGPLDHTQPIEPLLGQVVLSDEKRDTHVMRVWLDAGHTPRFVFPNGMRDLRGSYGRIIDKHRDTFPPEIRSQKISGIVENRKAVIMYGSLPHIRIYSVNVRGPLNDNWPSLGHQLVLGPDMFTSEKSPAIIARFAERAYRRPVTKDEIDRLLALERRRRHDGRAPIEALQDVLKAILCSPSFLYLVEPTTAGATTKALPPHALASRLSYFMWSDMPDDALLAAARSGELLQADALTAHARRLLADPRSAAFVSGFLDSWLNLRALGDMPPDRKDFQTYYVNNLQDAMKTETRIFVQYVLEQNRPVGELISADYTFANRALARLYGNESAIPPARAHEFQKITFTDGKRGGLLGQGSVLTVSANGIETSPIIRGVWVLENILGVTLPPPPDNVPPIDPDIRGTTSIRERINKHRENAACFECHRKIDPLGFALENYDPIGAWRSSYDEGKKAIPIDTSGQLPNGQTFKDVRDFKAVLIKRQELFIRALAEKMLSYACGRQMEAPDRGHVDTLMAALGKRGNGLRDLVELVVASELFRNK
jgi:Protein of unknown function (DUF1592)/Protein of unknown function (DUF1588)/Protein of unknown function (DUF1595)/Protein of unknown function (DUF1585)/Protein of unknown function (DUF1587)